jgi:glycerol uptake facilitator-like aquaporin
VSAARIGLPAAALCEFIATAFLLIAVVGSGIAAERLSGGNIGIALLANAFATSAALFVLILVFAPVSGAHMNPAVTVAAAIVNGVLWKTVCAYVAAQVSGAIVGTWIAHAMFATPIFEFGSHIRTGAPQWLAEAVAVFGLLGVIWGCLDYGTPVAAAAVAAYIGGAYWFTASTSFANPAVTIARALTDTFSGIRPSDAPAFIAAQAAGLVVALPALRALTRTKMSLNAVP